MKNLFRNFWLTLTRFKTASILNILGLTVAFAVFIVIMTQTYWETTYNKKIQQHEQIFALRLRITENGKERAATHISRPIGEVIGQSSPAIETYSLVTRSWGEAYFRTLETEGTPKEVMQRTTFVSHTFPDLLSLECLSGDFKRFEEPKTVIISKSVAEKLFPNGDPIGNSITNTNRGDTLQVVAVFQNLPKNCSFNRGIFINIGNDFLEDYSEWGFEYYYKLNSTNAQANVEAQASNKLKDWYAGIEEYEEENDEDEEDDEEEINNITSYVELNSFSQLYYSPKFHGGNRALTRLLTSIAILIILIAVINYVNFFMAMVPIRIRNININKVFGTPTATLRLNIIGEAVGLLLLSFALSLLVVEYLSGTFINDLIYPSLKITDNAFIVISTGIFVVITGVLAGLFPAFYITKFQPALVLRGSFGRSKQGQRLRSALVVFQFTISIALIIGASFVYLQSDFMQKHDYGFNRDRLVTVWVGSKIAAQPQAFVSELRKNPNILDVAYGETSLVGVGMMWGRSLNGEHIEYPVLPVSWNYPEFMGLKLKEGRFFIEDDASKSGGSYIFNEAAAKKFGVKAGDFMGGHTEEAEAEIVGIVENFNYTSLQKSIEPFALYEFGSTGWRIPSLAYIRLSNTADLKQTSEFITSCMTTLNPNMEVDKIKITPFDENIESLYDSEINITKIISLFSVVAIIISLMGVFGIVVFENQHRRKEIALRKIHGSTVALILSMFNRKFIIILSISAAIAVPLTGFVVSKWLSGFAYRTPMYWWVFVAGVLIVALITCITVTLQTLHTANENPVKAIGTNG